MDHLLSILTFLPLGGAVLLSLVSRSQVGLIKGLALLVSVVDLLLSLPLYFQFRPELPGMQFVENYVWIEGWGINYFVGVDGISLFMVLLTTFLTAIAILSSWTAITERVKEYMIFMLLLESGMMGVFVSLNVFLFYVFWEAMLIPMYFLIGIWGGPRRIYAAVKFFIYTMAGSLLMLVAILALYFLNYRHTGAYSFDLPQLLQLPISSEIQFWLFLAFGLSFAIKVPMFPFHTWLPDAHVEAPTAGSVILAGVLLKMGTYGFLRFCLPLFPQASMEFIPLISVLAIIGIIYGALVAMVQQDIKSLVAYSSVSHLGFVMLGIFAFNVQGIEGGLLQMVNHGLSTGALFLIVGMIYERRHTRLIQEYGGLSRQVPLFAIFFMIVTLSSIGLPGLNGFVGEFLVLVGAFKANVTYAVLAATGVILAAVYMLWMFQRVMFGPLTHPANRELKDLNAREVAQLVPIVLLIVAIGVYPSTLLGKMEPSVNHLLRQVSQRAAQIQQLEKAGKLDGSLGIWGDPIPGASSSSRMAEVPSRAAPGDLGDRRREASPSLLNRPAIQTQPIRLRGYPDTPSERRKEMPTVFDNLQGYRFFFFSLDRGEPMHIHVAKGRGYAKYWMRPVELARSRNFRSHELNEIAKLIEENRTEIERRWDEHFGREN